MAKEFKIGLLKETKTPPDKRVAIPPAQAAELMKRFPNVTVVAQPSDYRCFRNDEFIAAGVKLQEDVSDCDLLIGVKEVKIAALMPNKAYLFFAHVAKKQPHNREMLQAIVEKGITLLDHEYLTDTQGIRLVAFGYWAGAVGAYNALRGYGQRTNKYILKPAHQCHDYQEMIAGLRAVSLRPKKILVTGGGRVATGAMSVFKEVGIREVSPGDFLATHFNEPVVCRIDPWHYAKRKDGKPFDWESWANAPTEYESAFLPFTKVTDILVTGHFWDFRSPNFFSKADMHSPDFRIKVIADVSCDIPGPIPSTHRATTIAEPFYDYNPSTEQEEAPFSNCSNICMMTVDNLPGELPRDASTDFGRTLVDKVIPHFLGNDEEGVVMRASIVKEGKLTQRYSYLQNYLEGEE